MEETEDTKPWQFKSKEQLGGLDPRINSKGNPSEGFSLFVHLEYPEE
jgi:hypothetical protein